MAAKTINFTYEDKEYTLEFSRNTIRQMEGRGFVPEDIVKKPMTILPELFAGAFLKNHPTVRRKKIDEIYAKMNDKSTLVEALIELYNDPIDTLLEEPTEGNVEWSPSWKMEKEA